MNLEAEALTGGFAQPVFNAQDIFRMVMDGMARPGTLKQVVVDIDPPAPLGRAAGALALTLCDQDTPVWLSAGIARSAVPGWLAFHTGAPQTREKAEARFAFGEIGLALSSFGLFATGSQEYPDRSATLVLEISNLETGSPLTLTGPGIAGSTVVRPQGLPESFLRLWAENRTLFPRGIDVVLAAGRDFLCLPRTTKITVKEN